VLVDCAGELRVVSFILVGVGRPQAHQSLLHACNRFVEPRGLEPDPAPICSRQAPHGLLVFSSAARGQFECALQRSQGGVQPRLHEPFRDVEIVGDLRRRPT
jgi:hypothetical protein